ncbi:MAG: endonuclease SmrB, partial [Vibrio anguillarum]
MSQKETEHDDAFDLFRDAVKGVKKLRQDTIIQPPNRNPKQKEIRRIAREASDTEFYFSDEFIPKLSDEGPTRYARDDVSKYEV